MMNNRNSRKKRQYLFYLEDMLDSMEKISNYISGLELDAFRKDELIQDAVIRNFEVIGEAAKHIPDRVKNKYPKIPWYNMSKLRNFLAHQYFGVDIPMIWRIARDHIPGHKIDMQEIVERERVLAG